MREPPESPRSLVWHDEQRFGFEGGARGILEAFFMAGQNIDVHTALTGGFYSWA
jgi:hypothetical protein